jgi:hypothetical protein
MWDLLNRHAVVMNHSCSIGSSLSSCVAWWHNVIGRRRWWVELLSVMERYLEGFRG